MNSGIKTNQWLIGSVAINLIFVGALLGDWFSHVRRNPPPVHWATEELDERSRSAVRAILNEQKPLVRALRQDLRNSDSALMRIIRSPEIDSSELEQIFSTRQATLAAYQGAMQTSLEAILPALSPPQREMVLRRMLIESKPPRSARPKR